MYQFSSLFRADDRADQLYRSHPLILGSFSWSLWTSEYFKLPNFLFLDSATRLRGWLKQKGIFFLGKQIVTLSPVVHIKLSALSSIASHSCLPLLLSHLLLAAPLTFLVQLLIELTRFFTLLVILLPTRTKVLLEQRARFRRRLPPLMRLL
jgi:hypothetical protein